MSNLVHKFKKNENGRDFVVGDIHGCFDKLRTALKDIEFDEEKDRLFSVGDLVDRGPSSEECIDWICRPWFFAVRGNHEQMAIGVAAGRHDQANYLVNGGGWFLALEDSRQKHIAECLDMLPVAIEIEYTQGKVGIVHADIYGDSWDFFCEQLQTALSNNKRKNYLEIALWSRSRIQANQMEYPTAPVKDLIAMFVGHTPLDHATALANVFYIDTGACFGRSLTILEIGRVVEHMKL